MSETSAELPIEKVLAACDSIIAMNRESCAEIWDGKNPQITRASWIALGAPNNKADFINYIVERGHDLPHSKLRQLCLAARSAGEKKIRISNDDFHYISKHYK